MYSTTCPVKELVVDVSYFVLKGVHILMDRQLKIACQTTRDGYFNPHPSSSALPSSFVVASYYSTTLYLFCIEFKTHVYRLCIDCAWNYQMPTELPPLRHRKSIIIVLKPPPMTTPTSSSPVKELKRVLFASPRQHSSGW